MNTRRIDAMVRHRPGLLVVGRQRHRRSRRSCYGIGAATPSDTATARFRFRLGGLLGYTFLGANEDSSNVTFVSFLLDPTLEIRLTQSGRLYADLDFGLGVQVLFGLEPRSKLLAPSEMLAVNGAQSMVVSRFGAALGVSPDPGHLVLHVAGADEQPEEGALLRGHRPRRVAVRCLLPVWTAVDARVTEALAREAMQCVILAGGLATRMRPLTDTIPKALIPVDGRPFVDHQLAWLAAHGVTDVVLSSATAATRSARMSATARATGCASAIVDEGEDLRGTAGALRLALDEGALEESFLVTYGDSFLPSISRRCFAAFTACGQPALMTVFRNDGRWDTSNVIFDGQMVTLYDKQRQRAAGRGLHVHRLRPQALERRVIADEIAPGARADLADAVQRAERARRAGGSGGRASVSTRSARPRGLEDFEQWLRAKR